MNGVYLLTTLENSWHTKGPLDFSGETSASSTSCRGTRSPVRSGARRSVSAASESTRSLWTRSVTSHSPSTTRSSWTRPSSRRGASQGRLREGLPCDIQGAAQRGNVGRKGPSHSDVRVGCLIKTDNLDIKPVFWEGFFDYCAERPDFVSVCSDPSDRVENNSWYATFGLGGGASTRRRTLCLGTAGWA